MSDNKTDTKLKGDIGEQCTILDLLKNKLNILTPIGDRLSYDLVVEYNGVFKRIQCKYRSSKNGVIKVPMHNNNHLKRKTSYYNNQTIDAFAVYCPETDVVYYVNIGEVNSISGFSLRISEPKAFSSKDIKLAKNYINPKRLFDENIIGEEEFNYEKIKQNMKDRLLKNTLNTATRKVERPSKEDLARMIWEKPMTQIGREFGVSDNAIRKWCKCYGITNMPTRGYWQKVLYNKQEELKNG